MSKKKDVVNIIYKISQLILSISDADFKELEEMIENQKEYYNPLKMETTNKQHKLAEHNKKMVNCLKDLKQILIDGKPD